jgi:chromosome condensin MukBEF ATPase and DNA-binding subunit MukB
LKLQLNKPNHKEQVMLSETGKSQFASAKSIIKLIDKIVPFVGQLSEDDLNTFSNFDRPVDEYRKLRNAIKEEIEYLDTFGTFTTKQHEKLLGLVNGIWVDVVYPDGKRNYSLEDIKDMMAIILE